MCSFVRFLGVRVDVAAWVMPKTLEYSSVFGHALCFCL